MPRTDQLWSSVLEEARHAASVDRAYGRLVAKTVLEHPGLERAIAFQISSRLGEPLGYSQAFNEAAQEAFGDTELAGAVGDDLQGIVRRDYASPGYLSVLLHFKGFLAVQAWRVSHWLWRNRRRDLALLLQSAASEELSISIHPSAVLGRSVFLDHGTGIVIGPFSELGDDVTLLQNVTIGRSSDSAEGPRVGRSVMFGSGASVIGPFAIGDFAKVGAGTVVDRDVPAGCTAVGIPMRVTNCPCGDVAA